MSEKLSLNNKNNSKKNYKLKENLLPCNGLLTILETTFPLTKLLDLSGNASKKDLELATLKRK